MRIRWTTALAAVALAACTPAADQPPPAAPIDASSSAYRGSDDEFDASDSHGYVTGGQSDTFTFTTPAHQTCTMSAVQIACVAALPDVLPGRWRFQVGKDAERGTISRVADGTDVTAHKPPLLAGRKLVVDDGRAVCGVERSGAVSCRLGNHGFSSEAPWLSLY